MPEYNDSKATDVLKRFAPPALAAAGAYALLRHGKFNKTLAQKASGGKFTIIGERASYANPVTRKIQEIATGSKIIPIWDAEKLKKPIRGTVYMEVDQSSLKHYKVPFHPKAQVYNQAPKLIDQMFQDKLPFGKLKGKAMIPTQSMAEHTRGQ